MKFEIELDIEEGDIIEFNDETWVVDGYEGVGHSIDMKSVGTGRMQSFSRAEMQKNIQLSGRFTHVKKDYVNIV